MQELETSCPRCGEVQPFYRAASTTLHLGTKIKWYCSECDFGIVRIDGIDTSQ